MFTKLSIILFIRRLSSGTMWHVCNGFFVFHVLFGVASSFALAFQCSPVSAAYDLVTKLEHRCDGLVMYYVITSIGVASDMAILFLPIPIVLKLQLPIYKKVAVLLLFGLGGLACVFAILRMINLFDGVKGIDLTWDIVPVALFGQLEVTLAIIATSLPALKVLWKRWLPKFHFSIGSKIKRSHSSESENGGTRSNGSSGRSQADKQSKTTDPEIGIKGSEPNPKTDIEMGDGIVWRNVEFGNGVPSEDPNAPIPRGRSRNMTTPSTAEGGLLDESMYPSHLPPSRGRSRQNSKARSDISGESEISLSHWVQLRNNSFAVGTPLSPMPQAPHAVYDRPRKDSEVVVRW
ncbi:hypothetical protein ABW19_dt0207995 [Dactylella cylindrospora]|nr:hypothetical protein ABW19_dt0207995 [Dactylella cylindrospora]